MKVLNWNDEAIIRLQLWDIAGKNLNFDKIIYWNLRISFFQIVRK